MPSRPRPVVDHLTRTFWEAADRGTLLIQRCGPDGPYQWYPRAHSVTDWTASPRWAEATGMGVVHSYSVIERASYEDVPTPYVFAIVELEEGVLVSANIVGVNHAGLHVGMPVEAVFEREGDQEVTLVQFRPREA
jgi:uncharacterized OB-fold protein